MFGQRVFASNKYVLIGMRDDGRSRTSYYSMWYKNGEDKPVDNTSMYQDLLDFDLSNIQANDRIYSEGHCFKDNLIVSPDKTKYLQKTSSGSNTFIILIYLVKMVIYYILILYHLPLLGIIHQL